MMDKRKTMEEELRKIKLLLDNANKQMEKALAFKYNDKKKR